MSSRDFGRVPRTYKERQIAERLLRFSEETFEEDGGIKLEKDFFGSWQRTGPEVKSAPQKKKRPIPPPVIQHEEKINESLQLSAKYKNYELDFVDSPAWRTCVDPCTHRYLANNGRYRAYKFIQRVARERDSHKFSIGKPVLEQKTLIACIQRYFKNEFELFLRHEMQKEARTRAEVGNEVINGRCNSADALTVPVSEVHASQDNHENGNITHLPPIRRSKVMKSEARQYMNNRLTELNQEMRNRGLRRSNKSLTPDHSRSKALRSRSEPPPPGLGSLVDPIYQQDSLRKSESKQNREMIRNKIQVQQLADHLMNALSELKKTRDEELRKRFEIDEEEFDTDDPSEPVNLPEADSVVKDMNHSANILRKPPSDLNPFPKLLPVAQSIKYRTSSGDVISVPRFGHYTGLESNSNERETKSAKSKDKEVKDSPPEKIKKASHLNTKSLTAGNSGDSNCKKEELQSIITASKCPPIDHPLSCHSLAPRQEPVLEEVPKVILDGFQALPVGKPRHRRQRPGSPLIDKKDSILPEISGKRVSKLTTVNRVL